MHRPGFRPLLRRTTLAFLLGSLTLAGAVAAQLEGIHTVIQLGDSYSAGFGVLANDVPAPPPGQTHCDDPKYQAIGVTPGFRLTHDLNLVSEDPVSLVFEACGGAEVYFSGRDLAAQWEAVKLRLPELGTGEGTIIVMTFGGNDVRSRSGLDWPSVVQQCVLSSGCHEYPNGYDIQVGNLEEIALEFAIELATIVAEVPEAVVRVLGYPLPFQPELNLIFTPVPGGPVIPDYHCNGLTGISVDEANFLDGEAGALNQHLAMAVGLADQTTVVDMEYIDVEPYFRGHGACNTVDPFVNDVDWILLPPPIQIQANSMHPLARGWDAYYAALRDNLGL